jgi:hypothetical protein
MANLVVIKVYLMFYLFHGNSTSLLQSSELDTVQIFGVVGNSCEVDWEKMLYFPFAWVIVVPTGYCNRTYKHSG